MQRAMYFSSLYMGMMMVTSGYSSSFTAMLSLVLLPGPHRKPPPAKSLCGAGLCSCPIGRSSTGQPAV